jgi:signal transduction histidine kinase
MALAARLFAAGGSHVVWRCRWGESPNEYRSRWQFRKAKMEKSLAETGGPITILVSELPAAAGTQIPMAQTDRRRKRPPAVREATSGRRPAGGRKASARRRAKAPSTSPGTDDRFFRNIVRGMRNGVLAITRDGRVAVMNDIAYRILGLVPRPSDVGRPYADVLRSRPDLTRILAGAFELTHLPNRAELRVKETGKVIGYTLSQIRDERGRVAGAALFFKDLTRVEQLEERERLRDRLAALGEMAAAIAHEVKNPLAGIEVMAGLLKRQVPASADAQAILSDIINEAKMANAIVLEVLEFVRPIRLQVEHVPLHDVVADAVRMAESHVSRGGVTVATSLPGDLPPIQGDPHQLRQLFTNLLTNAFEALAGRGAVEISGVALAADEDHSVGGDAHPGPQVAIEVSDDGPGVPADVTDRIFSPFFTTKPQGSGLGLAIVRKIVDAHDGRIDVASRPRGGTVFRVTLPVTGSHPVFGTTMHRASNA